MTWLETQADKEIDALLTRAVEGSGIDPLTVERKFSQPLGNMTQA